MKFKTTIFIPNWHPTTLNKLLGGHWSRARDLKAADRETIEFYFRPIPWAIHKRQVHVKIIMAKGRRKPDPDAYWKSLLDALVHAKMLIDDNDKHCRIMPVEYDRGENWGTEITLEDI